MATGTSIEVYEWPEGAERSTDCAIDLIENAPGAPIPSVGDVILLPAPTGQFAAGTVDPNEYFIMLGAARPYRVVGREFMYSPRASGTDHTTPLTFSKVWIFVRAMTKDEYWGPEP